MRHFLRQCCRMKRLETQSSPVSLSSSRRSRYTKVKDNRKHAIRGLWRRNGAFLARLTVEESNGEKRVKWAKLKAATAAEAVEELKTLHVERRENRLRHIGQAPKLADYINGYIESLSASSKRAATIRKERCHLTRWSTALGHWRLEQLRAHHVAGFLDGLKRDDELSGRTANLYLIALRHVMKRAKRDGFLKALPTDDLAWQRSERKARALYSLADIETVCEAGLAVSKNGQQLADFLRLLAYSGCREQEALSLRWADVDFERKLLTVGAEGDTKNREARRVDFNSALEAHLRDMHSRRAPDSQWMFPSPQRGERDERAKTFRESLLLTRAVSGWTCQDCGKVLFGKEAPKACPYCQGTQLEAKSQALPEHLQRFGFHDCRHHFISFAVMSGIDYMTIARWVGHKDGGVLIGKVYGHLSNEHTQAQAARLNFGPTLATLPQAARA